MKTKPFDIQEALAGHPVVTRDGRKVIRIAHFPEAKGYPVLALIDKEYYALTFTEAGSYCGESCGYDLFLEAKTVKRWARVTRCISNGAMGFVHGYTSKEKAEAPDRVFYYVLPAYEYEIEE